MTKKTKIAFHYRGPIDVDFFNKMKQNKLLNKECVLSKSSQDIKNINNFVFPRRKSVQFEQLPKLFCIAPYDYPIHRVGLEHMFTIQQFDFNGYTIELKICSFILNRTRKMNFYTNIPKTLIHESLFFLRESFVDAYKPSNLSTPIIENNFTDHISQNFYFGIMNIVLYVKLTCDIGGSDLLRQPENVKKFKAMILPYYRSECLKSIIPLLNI